MTRSLRRQSRLRGCNLRLARWQTRFPRAPLTSTPAPHARLAGGIKMLALTGAERCGSPDAGRHARRGFQRYGAPVLFGHVMRPSRSWIM